jgi:hypothetical protein
MLMGFSPEVCILLILPFRNIDLIEGRRSILINSSRIVECHAYLKDLGYKQSADILPISHTNSFKFHQEIYQHD